MMLTISKQLWKSVIFVLLFVRTNAETDYAFVEGDVILAGLFDMQTGPGENCDEINTGSVMTLEAVRWYINQINDKRILPFKLGFKGFNTCGPPGKAVETALDLICQDKGNATKPLLGFLTLLTNEKEERLATVLSSTLESNRYLQLSLSATSNALKNRNKYPNFYRVIPDDSKQLKTVLLLMQNLRWNRVAIIYENNIEGRSLVLAFQELAKGNEICIGQIAGIKISANGEIYQEQIREAIDEVLNHEPSIKGVVYFGGDEVANYVLQRFNSLSVVDLPLFILSGNVGLKDSIFKSIGSGTPLLKSRGALIVTPAYTHIVSFSSYWFSVFTNFNHLRKEAVSNPWLNDVFASKSNTNCNPLTKNCIPLSLPEATKKFSQPELHIQYGIVAVHTFIKAVQNSYDKYCRTWNVSCAVALKSHMLIREMKYVVVDFGKDFDISVEPLRSNGYKLEFDENLEPDLLSNDAVEQVYNFQKLSAGDFGLLKVGGLTRKGKLYLNVSAVKDYDSHGIELSKSEWRKGQCPEKKRCGECIKKDIADIFIHIPGDVYVIGIAPVYDKGPGPLGCSTIYLEGYEIARALQFGLELFYSRQEYAEYRSKFGSNKIGMVILNSCRNDPVVTRKILDLHRYGIDLGNGAKKDIAGKILGYIGAFTSDITLRVAETLKEMSLVQISYSSTSPFLSEDGKYPHFLRVIPSDDAQAEGIIQIVEKLGGEYIQVIYAEKAYGEGAIKYLRDSASKHNICIAEEIVVEQKNNYHKYYEMIRSKPYAKIIVLILHHPDLTHFMQALQKELRAGMFQFVASDGWGKHRDLLNNDLADGAITVALEMKEVDGLIQYIQNQKVFAYNTNIWLEQYLQKRHGCYFDFSFDKTDEYVSQCNDSILNTMAGFSGDEWSNFATVSVLALLMGSAELYSKRCGRENRLCSGFTTDTKDLVGSIKDLSMNILGDGEIKLFNEKGDGNIGYSIYNVQRNMSNDNALTYVKVGKYDLQKGLVLDMEQLKYPLDKERIRSPCPNEMACKDCKNKFADDYSRTRNDSSGSSQSQHDSKPVIVALAVVVGILGTALVIVIASKFVGIRKKERHSGTQYITPIDAQVNRGTENYHDILMNEETRY